MAPQPNRPIACPLCGMPLLDIYGKLTCTYCRITGINWRPFKSLDLVHFTKKEIEDITKREEVKQKLIQEVIEKERKKQLEVMKK